MKGAHARKKTFQEVWPFTAWAVGVLAIVIFAVSMDVDDQVSTPSCASSTSVVLMPGAFPGVDSSLADEDSMDATSASHPPSDLGKFDVSHQCD